MPFPIKICSICSEEFELKPDKPGFANRCPDCTESDAAETTQSPKDAVPHKVDREANEARRQAMRNLLYPRE